MQFHAEIIPLIESNMRGEGITLERGKALWCLKAPLERDYIFNRVNG